MVARPIQDEGRLFAHFELGRRLLLDEARLRGANFFTVVLPKFALLRGGLVCLGEAFGLGRF